MADVRFGVGRQRRADLAEELVWQLLGNLRQRVLGHIEQQVFPVALGGLLGGLGSALGGQRSLKAGAAARRRERRRSKTGSQRLAGQAGKTREA